MKKRITGFDLARALAIFGMVIVNFKLAMTTEVNHSFLATFVGLFEGRAAALFVILAGVGVTLLTDKASVSTDQAIVFKRRVSLIKRGLLLIVIGLLYTPIWEADILHFYGFYFLIAALIFTVTDRELLCLTAMIVLLFPILMMFFDYERHWNWETLTYDKLWSVDGMVRHILFNGFHPVFPWAAFLVFGMWLGRQDLSQALVRKKLLLWSVFTLFITESSLYCLRLIIGDGSVLEITKEDVAFLFSTSVIPPLPQYIISAASSAVIVLMICVHMSERFSDSKLNQWLCKTGRLSLTLYVAHVIIGMGLLAFIDRLENQTIGFALLSACLFCVCGISFSVVWLKYFQAGPLEWLFRKMVN